MEKSFGCRCLSVLDLDLFLYSPLDAPQSIQTPCSMLAYTLSTTLQPADAHSIPISKSHIVYTRRFTSHSNILPASPETHSMEFPTHVNVQLPGGTSMSGEPILLYVTVPPPSGETAVNRCLMFCNIRTKLLRSRENPSKMMNTKPTAIWAWMIPILNRKAPLFDRSWRCVSSVFLEDATFTIISRFVLSNHYCAVRSVLQISFHPFNTVALCPAPEIFHLAIDSRTNLEWIESDIDTALITQSTLLPTVSFLDKVHICSTYHTSSIPCLLSLQELVTASHVVMVDEWTSSKLLVVDRRGALLSSVGYNHASSVSHSNPTATSGTFHAHVHVHLLLKIRILSHHTSRRDRKTRKGGTLEGLRYGFISPHFFSNTHPFLFFQASKVVAAIF